MGMSQRISNGALRRYSAAELIAFVTRTTLAEISTWSSYELQRIGWTDNPIVDILYSMTSAGVWEAKTDPSLNLSFVRWDYQNNIGLLSARPTIQTNYQSSVECIRAIRQLTWIPGTLVAGALADQQIWPALAGYYGVCKLKYWQQNSGNAQLWTMAFHDEDGTDCSGLVDGLSYNKLPADNGYAPLSFGTLYGAAGELGGVRVEPVIFSAADNKAIEMDWGGGGVEDVGVMFEGWYET